MSPPSERRVVVALLVVQVAFGAMAVAGKFVLPHMPALALTLSRLLCATAVLFALERAIVRAPRPPLRDLAILAGLAALGVALNQGLYLTGLQWTTATNALLLISTIPAFTVLVAVSMGREKAAGMQLVGLALSFGGVALLVARSGIDLGFDTLLGNVLIVANSFSYSLYLVLSRNILRRHDPLTVISWVFLLGAIEMALVATPSLLSTDWGSFDRDAWLGFAYVLLGGTVVTYGLNAWALRHATASRVASFIYLQPLVGALLAWWILDEQIGLVAVASGALILGGVALANVKSPYGRAKNPSE